MKNKIIFRILFIFTLFVALSCVKDDKWKDFQTFNSAYPVCGQYHVTWSLNGVLQDPPGPTILSLYNSAKGDSIWVDDNKLFWQFKVKAGLSGSNFAVSKGYDQIWDDSTTITKGSVTNDAIYMEVEWASSPGDVYVCQGKRQTGFE
ncbi:MAG: lipid-binding protein [Bacteroidales bacterium]